MQNDFRQALATTRLSQVQFRRLVLALSGKEVCQATVSNWSRGKYAAPATAIAVVKLAARLPQEEIAELLCQQQMVITP